MYTNPGLFDCIEVPVLEKIDLMKGCADSNAHRVAVSFISMMGFIFKKLMNLSEL